MKTKQEVKRNIMRRIMELRNKGLVEEDSILDILDDYLEPYINELEKERDKYKNYYEQCIMQIKNAIIKKE